MNEIGSNTPSGHSLFSPKTESLLTIMLGLHLCQNYRVSESRKSDRSQKNGEQRQFASISTEGSTTKFSFPWDK